VIYFSQMSSLPVLNCPIFPSPMRFCVRLLRFSLPSPDLFSLYRWKNCATGLAEPGHPGGMIRNWRFYSLFHVSFPWVIDGSDHGLNFESQVRSRWNPKFFANYYSQTQLLLAGHAPPRSGLMLQTYYDDFVRRLAITSFTDLRSCRVARLIYNIFHTRTFESFPMYLYKEHESCPLPDLSPLSVDQCMIGSRFIVFYDVFQRDAIYIVLSQFLMPRPQFSPYEALAETLRIPGSPGEDWVS